jgi:iron complex outermembrane receptor protein
MTGLFMFATKPARLAACLAAAFPVLAIAAAEEPEDVVEIVAARQPYRSLSATAATKTETALKDLRQSARVPICCAMRA